MALKNSTGVVPAPITGGTPGTKTGPNNSDYELVNVNEPTPTNGDEIRKPVGVDSGNRLPEMSDDVIPFTPPKPTGTTGTVDYVVASSTPTSPSWETNATELAKLQLVEDSATAEQSQLKSRQSIETNANKANNEFTLLTYQQNQNIEKMGWGGGSYHDAKMQESYLQASIQADLYGQLELQKYGYETEMAKARAAFDANQKQLALEYMKEEYTKAYNAAQMTGIWIDPTVKDRLAQWDIATKMMKEYEGNPESAEYKKAKRIKEEILGTFNFEEGTVISEQGIDVLRQILEQQNLYSTRTLTAAQIKDMEITTDNAKELVEKERVKEEEAKGIYTYTDTNGNKIKVDIFNGSPEEIKALIAEMPSLKFVAMGSFTDKLNAEYESWRKLPGNESKTMADFQRDMKGTYDTYKAEAENWARKAGLTEFLFNGKVIKVGQVAQAYTPNIIDGNVVPDQSDAYAIMDILQTPENEELHQIYLVISEFDPSKLEDENWREHWLAQASGVGFYADYFGDKNAKADAAKYEALINDFKNQFGEKNIELLLEEAKKYNEMSERDKGLLSNEERANYERVTNFVTSYTALLSAYKYASMNDTNVFDGFAFVADQWQQVGDAWSKIKNIGDALGAIGETTGAIVDTVVGGVIGIVKWMFGIK